MSYCLPFNTDFGEKNKRIPKKTFEHIIRKSDVA